MKPHEDGNYTIDEQHSPMTALSALRELVQVVTDEANEPGGRGISGRMGARLSDARQALAAAAGVPLKPYHFTRYRLVHGGRIEMAEGVLVHASTMPEAESKARGLLMDETDELVFTGNQRCACRCPICDTLSERAHCGREGRIEALERAIQDIWDKATPYGPGIVENGENYVDKYIMPAGPLHRAKGLLVSNPAPWAESPKTVVHGMNILGHEDRTLDKSDIPNPRGDRFGTLASPPPAGDEKP